MPEDEAQDRSLLSRLLRRRRRDDDDNPALDRMVQWLGERLPESETTARIAAASVSVTTNITGAWEQRHWPPSPGAASAFIIDYAALAEARS